MIPHRAGELLGAHFVAGGKVFISLARGPGNTIIGYDKVAYEKNPLGGAPLLILPLPKANEIMQNTPVDSHELEPRP